MNYLKKNLKLFSLTSYDLLLLIITQFCHTFFNKDFFTRQKSVWIVATNLLIIESSHMHISVSWTFYLLYVQKIEVNQLIACLFIYLCGTIFMQSYICIVEVIHGAVFQSIHNLQVAWSACRWISKHVYAFRCLKHLNTSRTRSCVMLFHDLFYKFELKSLSRLLISLKKQDAIKER